MHLLWVKVGGLWPLNTGGRLRSFHLIKELSQRHRVTVLTTHGSGDDPAGLAESLPACERVVSFPYNLPKRGSARFATALMRSWLSTYPVDLWKCSVASLANEVKRSIATGSVDLCVSDFLYAAPNVPFGNGVPVLFFAHNVEHHIWQRMSWHERRAWRRALIEIESSKMRRWEADTCRRAHLTLAVSETDRTLLQEIAPQAKTATIPTGVDTTYFTPNGGPAFEHSLVFTGSLDWFPNEDAILYFLNEMLPAIRAAVPDVTFTAVGRNPTARLRAAIAAAGVSLTGTVEDVRPYVSRSAVFVVPLRIGSGTRLKIFEALAMGKAVVSTTIGAEGLGLDPGTHFLQADSPDDFVRAVTSLLRDPARRDDLAHAARELVETHYSWPQVANQFEAHCRELLQFTSGGRGS